MPASSSWSHPDRHPTSSYISRPTPRVRRHGDAARRPGRYGAAVRAHDLRRRLSAAGPWALDALLALAATAAGVLVLASVLPPRAGDPRTAAAYALVVAHSLPIAVRRRFPLPVLAWALATGLAFAALGFNLVPLGLSILIYVYTVASQCRRPVALAALAATEALLVLVFLVWPNALGDRTTLLSDLLAVAAAWWLGDGTRRRQDAIAAARQRAAELERAREELARTAVVEERLRIARELHDVVAHSMSIIAVQSGVGAHVLDRQPEEARKALAAVEVTSRQALTEVARAGARVEVRIEGTRPELSLGLDLSAYRIVQEALTNVVRHAGPATARVRIRYAADAVDLEVVDDGVGSANGRREPDSDRQKRRSGRSGRSAGHGILGMRERAALYGGTLDAGPLPGGGFRVAAHLPVEPSDRGGLPA
jgi:signal transduction histidine kinase